MPSLSTVKLVGGLVVALFIAFLIADRSRFMHRAHVAEAQSAADCQATRTAANQPKLDCKQVPQQIGFLGQTVTALSNALKVQNAAVASLGQRSADQQQASAKASQVAQGRAREAEATSTRLNASSRSGEAQAKPCEASKALKEAWK